MGWLANMIFGKPDDQETALPKKVEQWNRGDGSVVTVDEADKKAKMRGGWGDAGAETNELEERQSDPTRDQAGQKIMPEVWVEQLKLRPNSDMSHIEVWAVLKNQSEFEVEITKVMLLGDTLDPNRFIKPNATYELMVYNGDTPESESYKKLALEYKIVRNGDYFQADHLLQYRLEQEGTKRYYLPEEVTPLPPIRDI